ncbi:diguanylate cyclase, partial [Candidatus Magnetominusculus dajiuhuensis]|uniref:sensor domain-containing diguanylate cyclase n=1 Tax=Candidatus Magnetominusculus dajiuhuensis TaxID=3137712 RepID=UPI003B435B2C
LCKHAFSLSFYLHRELLYFVHMSEKSMVEEQVKNNMETQAYHTIDKIDRMLFEKYTDIKQLAYDPVIASQDSTPQAITQRLNHYLNHDKTYVSLSFFNMDRVRIADTSGKDIGQQHPLNEYWPKVETGSAFTAEIYESSLLKGYVYCVAAIVKNEHGKPVGVVKSEISMNAIYDIVNNVSGLASKDKVSDTKVVLVDKNGLILYSNHNKGNILKTISDDWEFVSKLIIAGDKTGSIRHLHKSGDEEILAFSVERGYQDFTGNGWSIIVDVPAKLAFGPFVKLRDKKILSFVIMSFFALAAIYIFARTVSKPIIRLSSAAREVGAGNLDIKVDVKSHDEIGKMAESFNKMVDDLRNYRDKSEVYGKELEAKNAKLEQWSRELAIHNHENQIFSHMSDLLQACNTISEACEVIAHAASRLFQFESGGIYVFNSSRDIIESISTWGRVQSSEQVFTKDDCWALRRGRSHIITAHEDVPRCRHVIDSIESYICVPMTAQGETLGMCHLMLGALAGDSDLIKEKERLALKLSENAALAISNLKLRETLSNLSSRDPLTGLYNRRYMQEYLERENQRSLRKKTPIGIIMIDVDHFKRFNDTYGHEAGDCVLRELGIFLKHNIRDCDVACRYGGEEFTLILPEATLDITVGRATMLCDGFKHVKINIGSQTLSAITLSVGVAVSPIHGTNPQHLLKAADEALYQAKHEGRDRVVTAQTSKD